MTKLTFIEFDGTAHEVDAPDGTTIMRAALEHGVPGIMADCGGECSCATCHAYLDPAYFALVGAPSDDESDMLECAIDVEDNSRLTCQVKITSALDGLTVRLPASQI